MNKKKINKTSPTTYPRAEHLKKEENRNEKWKESRKNKEKKY